MERIIKQRLVTTIMMMVVSVGCIFAQSNVMVNSPDTDLSKSDEIFEVVDENPTFPGGDSAMMEFLRKNLKYPKKAIKNNIQGRILMSFVVAKDGSITNVKIQKEAHPLLNKEAMRIVKKMPKWKPGKKNGKVVRVRFTLPITFRS